jgi:hypothetical protein
VLGRNYRTALVGLPRRITSWLMRPRDRAAVAAVTDVVTCVQAFCLPSGDARRALLDAGADGVGLGPLVQGEAVVVRGCTGGAGRLRASCRRRAAAARDELI